MKLPINSQPFPRKLTKGGIAYYLAGEGTPVVLIHGVGLRAESFASQIEALKDICMVYAIDMPGHGESVYIATDSLKLNDFTIRVREFVDEVIGVPVVMIGHSMGAMIAIDFAIHHGELCFGVIALNAVFNRSQKASEAVSARVAAMKLDDGNDFANGPVRRWFGENPSGHDVKMARLCQDWLNSVECRGYADAYRVFASNSGADAAELSAMEIPLLFLTGENDLNSTPAMSDEMARLVPQGEAVTITNAGHMAQLTHAHEINTALRQFIGQMAKS